MALRVGEQSSPGTTSDFRATLNVHVRGLFNNRNKLNQYLSVLIGIAKHDSVPYFHFLNMPLLSIFLADIY